MLFQFIKGSGKVAGLLDEKKLVIWWKIRPNHYQSVLFTANTSLADTFKTGQLWVSSCHRERQLYPAGDAVTFEGARRNTSGVSNWVASQVRLRADQKKES